jgi:hypothetical protein
MARVETWLLRRAIDANHHVRARTARQLASTHCGLGTSPDPRKGSKRVEAY